MNRRLRTAAWLALLSGSAMLGGCGNSQGTFRQLRINIENGLDELIFYRSQTEDPVLADVGSLSVRSSDFLNAFKKLHSNEKKNMAFPDKRQGLLDRLIEDKAWVLLAQRAGVERDRLFRADLARAQEELLSKHYKQRYSGSDLAVSDSEIKAYYETHSKEFGPTTDLYASRIVVKKAEDARKVAKLSNSDNFEEMARRLSLEPEARRAVPFRISVGRYNPEVERALLNMKIGQISPIIPYGGKFNLFKKMGEVHWPAPTFGAARSGIRKHLTSEKAKDYIQKAVQQIPVRMNPAALSSVPLPGVIPATSSASHSAISPASPPANAPVNPPVSPETKHAKTKRT